jgi:AraC-like DNA-binding protein
MNVSSSSTAQIHSTMERARRFIEQNFHDEAAIRKYLQSTGLSDSWFRRLFREKYGIAPMSLRLRLLHERAQRLLLNTNLTIKEISFQLGYDSQNYFSRAFKKSEGVSPAHFRARAPRA